MAFVAVSPELATGPPAIVPADYLKTGIPPWLPWQTAKYSQVPVQPLDQYRCSAVTARICSAWSQLEGFFAPPASLLALAKLPRIPWSLQENSIVPLLVVAANELDQYWLLAHVRRIRVVERAAGTPPAASSAPCIGIEQAWCDQDTELSLNVELDPRAVDKLWKSQEQRADVDIHGTTELFQSPILSLDAALLDRIVQQLGGGGAVAVSSAPGKSTEAHGVLLVGPAGCGKSTLASAVAERLHVNSTTLSALSLSDNDAFWDRTNAEIAEAASACQAHAGDLHLLILDDLHALAFRPRATQRLRQELLRLPPGALVLGCAQDSALLPKALHSLPCLNTEINVSAPALAQRLKLFAQVCADRPGFAEAAAQLTAGYSWAELQALRRLVVLQEPVNDENPTGSWSPTAQNAAWLYDLLAQVRPATEGLFASRPARPPPFIGGYETLRQRLQNVVGGLKDGRFERMGLRPPSGLLLYGPTGCGKSALVQWLAAEAALPFFTVDTADLFSRYLGQTEANIRTLFRTAREAQPCILYLDQIDILAARRSAAGEGDSDGGTGVGGRALSTLLNEMDGITANGRLLVVGSTNRDLDGLDAAILRPGRLELHELVALPDQADREAIIAEALGWYHLQMQGDDFAGSVPSWLASQISGYSSAALVMLIESIVAQCLQQPNAGSTESPDTSADLTVGSALVKQAVKRFSSMTAVE